MQPLIVIPDAPSAADREAILDVLVAYNDEAHGPSGYEPVAVLVKHPETGATIGGLWGRIVFDWLFVELLVVPEEARGTGVGSRLMAEAEARAKARNCAGIWLDTFAFQAPGFYAKLGFEPFGRIDDHPRGKARYFLQKRLAG